MLCDDAILTLKSVVRSSPDEESRAANVSIAHAIERAQRFVLSPLVVETAAQLAVPERIDAMRVNLFTPARLTWLEWSGQTPGGYAGGNRHGLLLIGSDMPGAQIHVGWGAYFLDTSSPAARRRASPLPLTYDFPADDRPLMEWILSPLDALGVRGLRAMTNPEMLLAIDLRQLAAFAAAALAIINTPRLSFQVDHRRDAINAGRDRRGAPAYLSYKEVRIAIDRGTLGIGGRMSTTHGRALHHVRAFLRLKRGKVELVSPHWRGNPRFGVVIHRYLAFRAEDEPGPWKGGPLPAPVRIKQMDEEPHGD
jgi:hypothetical protein